MIFAEGESFSPTDKSFTSSSAGLKGYTVTNEYVTKISIEHGRCAAAELLDHFSLLPRYFILYVL